MTPAAGAGRASGLPVRRPISKRSHARTRATDGVRMAAVAAGGGGRMRRCRVLIAVACALLLVAAACGGDDSDDAGGTSSSSSSTTSTTTTTKPAATSPPTTAAPPPPAVATLASVSLGLQPVVQNIELATAEAWRAGDPGAYVTTQKGFLYRVDHGVAQQILDLSAEVPDYAPGSERGLLGIAFDPRDGRMFLHLNDRENNSHIVSFTVTSGIVDAAS